MSHKKYREDKTCLNCGHEVAEKYCPNCGQENLETRENFFHLVGHFISDYLHFDGKFFKSLQYLFFRPGKLTKAYWEGKRVQYIHPLRLFFFITILFMLASGTFYNRFGNELKQRVVQGDTLYQKLDTAHLATLPDTAKITLPGGAKTMTAREARENIKNERHAVENIRKGFDFVFTMMKYITFLLLPLYALIFKLLYIRRRDYYVDHLVYTMHLQSFAYCLIGLAMVMPLFLPLSMDHIRIISFFGLFIYIGFSLSFIYRQVWWKTILKSFLATVSLFLLTILSFVLIALVKGLAFH